MTPQYVDPKGGTVVTLTGWNLDRATGVQLDGVPVRDWTLVDGSLPPATSAIRFVAPPHRAGTISRVIAPPGTEMTGLSGELFYGARSAPRAARCGAWAAASAARGSSTCATPVSGPGR